MDGDGHPPPGSLSSRTPPPPPPKPYPSSPLQRLPSLSAALKPFSPNTPVRRKPLPSNANAVTVPGSAAPSPSSDDPTSKHRWESSPGPDHPPVVSRPEGALSPRPSETDPRLTRIRTDERASASATEPPSRIAAAASAAASPPNGASTKRANGVLIEHAIQEQDMGLKPGARPPPLRTDSSSSTRSLAVGDAKKPQTPGSKFTSFFSRKPVASPGAESAVTDLSDRRSPLPSPFAGSPPGPPYVAQVSPYAPSTPRGPQSHPSQDSIDFDGPASLHSRSTTDVSQKLLQLENELREISLELASSIKREMDLEDLVEQLQIEGPPLGRDADRTSDYFSDSGASSVRPPTSEGSSKEELQRIKRESEQLRAQLKVEMSQKWQSERSGRQALEAHVQILEQKLTQSRHAHNESADITARAKELEVALDDAKRRLVEERQTKENFEDLLTALRVDLEQHRNERDHLRDEVVPQLRAHVGLLEASLAAAQATPADGTRLQQELQSLKDENAALHSARMMNMQFAAIAEEGEAAESPTGANGAGRSGGLQRSNTVHMNRSNSRAQPNRSNSLSRSNSTANRAHPDASQSFVDQLKDVTEQRNALHSTVRYLLRRQEAQRRMYEKRIKVTEVERDRANSTQSLRKGGYEREVRTLRSEINLLRKRADDALEQKWQCEKGLAGLKMDLDRSKQETASLQALLQVRDETAPEVLSSTLEQALRQLQQQQDHVRHQESLHSLNHEQELSTQLELSVQRSESLVAQVRKQMQANADLRNRLKDAVEKGELNQQASAEQVNELQARLRKLEDVITVAQMHSETAVMKHEEEVRVLRASHNVQLMRTRSGRKTPTLRSPMLMNATKSPRLDQTSSGPAMALQQALKTEYLERKVEDLERALAEAEKEMEEVVGRMNTAQIGVAELEQERDEALRQTRRLEAAVVAEREKVQTLIDQDYAYTSDY